MAKRSKNASPWALIPIAVVLLAGILLLFNLKTFSRVVGPRFQSWRQSTTERLIEAGKKKKPAAAPAETGRSE